MVSVPGQETKIPYASGPKKKKMPKYKTEAILQQIQLKTLKTGLHLNRETSMETYTLPYVKQKASGTLLCDPGELKLVLCDNLEGGRWEGRSGGRGHMYPWGRFTFGNIC